VRRKESKEERKSGGKKVRRKGSDEEKEYESKRVMK